ncbi:MAG TPA: methylenetetrahydrofolate reductase [NAD(P)H], partial [Candidatus Solibacter sp.]|nr:methylenetetrahydrofolate reductase [NAD(P)H] [Candidatus Solibacter sp.]
MRIGDLLARGLSFSFEFFPPKTDEAAQQLERTIAELRDLAPTFVSVTYGAGGSTREKTIEIVTRIKRETGIEAMAHLTCAGSGREELRAVLARIVDSGVENVLALRGDPPRGQTVFTPVDSGFRYANELVQFIRDIHGSGLCLGGACYPEKHIECPNPAVDLTNLKRKVEAGLEFVITQLFFDNRHYFEFIKRARGAGIQVPIIPGIMPITNVAQIERMTLMCGATIPFDLAAELDRRRDDPPAALELGIAHSTEQCNELLAGGAPGIHFYTLNRSTATRQILSN